MSIEMKLDYELSDNLFVLEQMRDLIKAGIHQWGSQLQAVENKISDIKVRRYLSERNIDLKVGDKLVITTAFKEAFIRSNPSLGHYYPIGYITSLDWLRWQGNKGDELNGGIKDDYGCVIFYSTEIVLEMRREYLRQYANEKE